MRARVVAALATLLFLLAGTVAAAPASSAHNACTGTCNKVQNLSNVGLGIYDYRSDPGWKWIQNPNTWSNSWNLYQQDVEGIWIGPPTGGMAWCFQVWQGNTGPDIGFGYWGVGRGPYRFEIYYWAFNKIRVWQVPVNDHC